MFAIWDTVKHSDWQVGTITAIQTPRLVVYIPATEKYDIRLFDRIETVDSATLVLK